MVRQPQKFIFVFNGKTGWVNLLMDILHKLFRPKTYPCPLCALTHGLFFERRRWRAFHLSSDHQFVFLHKDEFEDRYPERYDYPVILEQQEQHRTVVADASQIRQWRSVDDLIASFRAQ